MKINFKRLSLYFCVILVLIGTFILFKKAFNFDNEKNQSFLEVDEKTVNDLYGYLVDNPVDNISFYSKDFTNYNGINYYVNILIYSYISKNNLEYLNNVSKDEFLKYDIKDSVYLLKEDDYIKVGQKLFGKNVKLHLRDFVVSDTLSAKYISDVGFVIYECDNEIKGSYQIEKIMTRYDILDNGKVIVIYDNYVICDKVNKECYNSENLDDVNKIVYNTGDINLNDNLNNFGHFKHTFRYEDGSYYWSKSEKCNI